MSLRQIPTFHTFTSCREVYSPYNVLMLGLQEIPLPLCILTIESLQGRNGFLCALFRTWMSQNLNQGSAWYVHNSQTIASFTPADSESSLEKKATSISIIATRVPDGNVIILLQLAKFQSRRLLYHCRKVLKTAFNNFHILRFLFNRYPTIYNMPI